MRGDDQRSASPPRPDPASRSRVRLHLEGFLGCLYAGAIAVPAYPPDPLRFARTVPRLRSLAGDCGATVALTVSGLAEAVHPGLGEAPELAAMEWIATDTLPEPADPSWAPPRLPAQAPALLQYSPAPPGSRRECCSATSQDPG